MFYRVKNVSAMSGWKLFVEFANGTTKTYDMVPFIDAHPALEPLKDWSLFEQAAVDVGGYGVVWNDDYDVSANELWENGVAVKTPFDGLMSFADASSLWGLSESTLRKAVVYGKIVPGLDARKYGKQWIVSRESMVREYGEPAA